MKIYYSNYSLLYGIMNSFFVRDVKLNLCYTDKQFSESTCKPGERQMGGGGEVGDTLS